MSIDEENTLRTLKDEPHLVAVWGCRFGWHYWTLWGNPYRIGDKGPAIQQAHCGFCNKVKVRNVRDEHGRTV